MAKTTKFLAILTVLALLTVFYGCVGNGEETVGVRTIDNDEPLEPIEGAFSDARIALVLTKEASLNFKTYTPEDFPEIKCASVNDATRLTMEVVKQQLEAQRTGDWSALKERIEVGMLVDIENFKRILYLELSVKSKENVLKGIKLLEKRKDVLYAGPDYKMELCGTLP